jgi:ribosomal protein L11 methyltransferase
LNYISLHIDLGSDFIDILIAELGELGFESFEDTDTGFNAYIPENQWDEQALVSLKDQYQSLFQFTYQVEKIAEQNWNAVWEADYQPVLVADKCLIKSSFHQIKEAYPYQILINPKMSFGTGHHETTTQMMEHELEMDFSGKNVLDAGCGTGVLAILAEKLGALAITAYDIDEWAVNNTLENIELNDCKRIQVWQGTINSLTLNGKFQIILANIQKNVLLEEIPAYVQLLDEQGELLMSGFYEADIHDILSQAQKYGLNEVSRKIRNQWTALRLRKQDIQ